eukprot:CAMPEP_0172614050 /NCGR_PEP_ID=MMETSP1068-20121228/49158_1 /TAXON_ID=35684 /ORGANISM="Pseudopedinella elastica, Strain CCMP716" /LENGTH=447 /DNA_ID=CAMNT_0013418719 /DNA_START=74 /DNA_END=1414 /DNA_ORIENTATION=-
MKLTLGWRSAPLALLAVVVSARPLVREIKDQAEFNKLLKHHAANTGLPVVAKFYSDSCGPCRMMAPVFKNLARENADKAVFVNVNTQRNGALGSTYQVSGIPTFISFGGDGKLKSRFSGAGEAQLREMTKDAVRDAERMNVRVTLDSLGAFYATHDPSKDQASIADLHGKCAKLSATTRGAANKGQCEGGAAAELAAKLKKKYKATPKLSKRSDPPATDSADSAGSASKGGGERGRTTSGRVHPSSSSSPSSEPEANLDLATLAELEAAVRQRRLDLGLPVDNPSSSGDSYSASRPGDDAYDDDEEDDEEEEEEEEEEWKKPWVESGEPERVVVIGSGPAGLSAAIYAARAGLKPVVVAPPFGGQLMGKGVDVENFPGLLEQTGPGVVNLMLKQAASFGTVFHEDEVTSVDLKARPFSVRTLQGELRAHAVVVATGADSKWLGVEGE